MIGSHDFCGLHGSSVEVSDVTFPPGNLVGSIIGGVVKHPGRVLGFDKPGGFDLMLPLNHSLGSGPLFLQGGQVRFGAFGAVLPHYAPIPSGMIGISRIPDRLISSSQLVFGRLKTSSGGDRIDGGAIGWVVFGVVMKVFG